MHFTACFACCAKLVFFLSAQSAAAMMSKETWLTRYWYLRVSLTRVWLRIIFSLSCSVVPLALFVFQTPRVNVRQVMDLGTTIFRLAEWTFNLDYFLFGLFTSLLLAFYIYFCLSVLHLCKVVTAQVVKANNVLVSFGIRPCWIFSWSLQMICPFKEGVFSQAVGVSLLASYTIWNHKLKKTVMERCGFQILLKGFYCLIMQNLFYFYFFAESVAWRTNKKSYLSWGKKCENPALLT